MTGARLAAATRLDLRLQRRYGIWGAAAVVTVVWVVLLRLLPAPARDVAALLVVFLQLAVVGYTFAGAQVLLEKGERSVTAVAVTPLRVGEYVAAKVVSLTLLAVAVTLVLVAAAEVPVSPPPLVAGVGGLSAIGLLAGLASVAPFGSLTRWLFPSVGPMLVLAVPLVAELGVTWPVLWLLPTAGPYRLLAASFGAPAGAGTVTAALAVTGVWVATLAAFVRRRFDRALRAGQAGW